MIDHVTIRVADRAASERFYDTLLGALGVAADGHGESFTEWGDFSVAQAGHGHPATSGVHLGFAAPSREHVDRFWQAGIDAGHRSDGEPGPRPQYAEDYYGAFLLDPDGNSAEAVHHAGVVTTGNVDHVWLRVADIAAAKAFYETIAPHAGLALRTDTLLRVSFAGPDGETFSLVAGGTPTRHVHMAFPASDDAAVQAFHRAATAAGHPDNGAPGGRPEYHEGYYGAFVLDPDGNNIEVVNHRRGA